MPVSKNYLRNALSNLATDYAEKEGTDLQSALRDTLTDLQHIAASNSLDFDKALAGSKEVYEEELQEEQS